ncbi:hypothetical protein BGZ47_000178 [Haplosporangium gracile]|nr:hypothetical protein BGZ47_000178 [Haplosporangium gracile]
MREQGRHIAPLIDSAFSHGNSENLRLTNVTIIRLSPHTTSLTQPLGAGIIRSFKANYSKEMLQNAKLWPCFASSWEKVMPGCICNCFAKVLIMSRVHAEELKRLGFEFAQDQAENLQTELIDKYGHLEDIIASQNDIDVLNYIAMINSEGPDETTLEAVKETLSADEFKEMFYQDTEDEGEDDEETEGKEDDSDFELSDDTFSGEDPDPMLVLRNSNAYARDSNCASPPFSPLEEEYTDLLRSDNFPDSLDNIFMVLRDDNTSADSTALKRLIEAYRSVDAANDYFALTTLHNNIIIPSDPVMETLKPDTESGEGVWGLEEEEEEEDALIRLYHYDRM